MGKFLSAAWFDAPYGRPVVVKSRSLILADDHVGFRSGIRALLERAGFTIVAEASSGREAVTLVAHFRPDAVVMDLHMPDGDGIEATRQIVASGAETKVIALSASNPAEAHAILEAGATDFINKERAFGELVEALNRLLGVG